jgi:hypothetical protein
VSSVGLFNRRGIFVQGNNYPSINYLENTAVLPTERRVGSKGRHLAGTALTVDGGANA